MKLFVAQIFTEYSIGFLGYMDSWDTYSSMSDAKLFSTEDEAVDMAKDFVKYMGQEYTYKIVTVTLTITQQ